MERRFSVVEGLEAVAAANLQRAERLYQSLLQKAFSGRLVTHGTVSRMNKRYTLADGLD